MTIVTGTEVARHLTLAKAMIDKPETWCRSMLAKTKDGKAFLGGRSEYHFDYSAPEIAQRCALAAIQTVGGSYEGPLVREMSTALFKAYRPLRTFHGVGAVCEVNNAAGGYGGEKPAQHAALMAIFDAAIAANTPAEPVTLP